jgi:1-acyl-sn-glycerol-3-phosphate acyltransferase
MKLPGRLLISIYSVYGLLMFIIIMLLIFPFVMAALLLGRIKGGNMIYRLCRVWGILWYAVTGIRHSEIYEAPHDRQKQYIFLANHISYMDIPSIVMSVHQPVRVLGKSEMRWIPVFGWIYRAAVILVNRSNAATRAKSVRALKAALKQHISIFLFPEGTFNETGEPLKSFFDGAFRIAVETQTSIKPLLFIDTLDRLHCRGLLQLIPGRNRTVYLAEIPVTGLSAKDIPALKRQVFTAMEEGLRRYRRYPSA